MTKDEIFKRAFDNLKEESDHLDLRWDDIIDYITEYNIDENLDDLYNNITEETIATSELCDVMSEDEAKAHLISNAIMDKILESVMQGNY